MTRYRNRLAHATDLPGGALLAPGDEADLDEADAAPLVEAGILAPAPVEAAPAKSTRKGGES